MRMTKVKESYNTEQKTFFIKGIQEGNRSASQLNNF